MGMHTGEQLIDKTLGMVTLLEFKMDPIEWRGNLYLITDKQGVKHIRTENDIRAGRLRVPYWWEYDPIHPEDLAAHVERIKNNT